MKEVLPLDCRIGQEAAARKEDAGPETGSGRRQRKKLRGTKQESSVRRLTVRALDGNLRQQHLDQVFDRPGHCARGGP